MRFHPSVRVASAAALMVVATACGGNEAEDPIGPGRTFSGTVTSVLGAPPSESPLESVWMDVGGREVGVVVLQSTVIDIGAGRIGDIRPGMRIRVVTGSQEYLSTPPQYDAIRISAD